MTTIPVQRVPVCSVITPPEPFVTVQDVKDFQVIEHSLWDNARVPLALSAAHALVEGPRGIVGRALGVQTLEMSFYDDTAQRFALLCPPVLEIVSVTYDDADNNAQTLDAGAYYLSRGAFVASSTLPTFNELRVRYRAGYEISNDSPTELPKELQIARMAILLMVGDFLSNTTASVDQAVKVNPAVERLLDPLKIRTIA